MSCTNILLYGKDKELYKNIREFFSLWDMKIDIVMEYKHITDEIKNNAYNIILLEVSLLDNSNLDIITQIHDLSPKSEIVLIIDCDSQEEILRSFHMDVYDLLKKPFSMTLLAHKIVKILEIQDTETELLHLRSRLWILEQEYIELNKALSFIVRSSEKREQEEKQKLILQMRNILQPLLKDISKDKNMEIYESQFSLLLQYLDDLHSDNSSDFEVLQSLSSRELRIVTMIKQGLTNRDIADHLQISSETVKTHRRNIRKKLGIAGTKNRLSTMLQHNNLPIVH